MNQQWVMVSGDFVANGGMDLANLRLAQRLCNHGGVQLVSHNVDAQLTNCPNAASTLVSRPLKSHFLGQYMLKRYGAREVRRQESSGGRTIVNGGNCQNSDVNWVHYVHAAHVPLASSGILRPLKHRLHHQQALNDERLSLRTARYVVCNSQLTARHVQELLNVPERLVRVVYLTTDLERFPVTTARRRARVRQRLCFDDVPYVLFAGDLMDYRKGFDVLIEAWGILCGDGNWDANLVVAGRGAEASSWRSAMSKPRIKGSVKLLGFREDIPDLLAACDLLVHPTRYEAYGLAVHEAISTGLPALVSKSAGIAERYPPDLADLLIDDSEDANELAERLRRWRNAMGNWKERVRPFSDALRSYSWDDMSRCFIEAVDG